MKKTNSNKATDRRNFLTKITAGVAGMGFAGLLSPWQKLQAETVHTGDAGDPDDAFKMMKGKHRIVYDVIKPNGIFPFAWPRVYLLTNQGTGSTADDCNVVVVLRHEAIPYAFGNDTWAKYKFGEMFKADDPATKKPATRNPFWMPAKGDFTVPGIGPVEIGINELQQSGVIFCVCSVAMTVYSHVMAQSMNMDADMVMKDWMAGLLPGVKPMPSGVWAVGRAQEHGCAYCYCS